MGGSTARVESNRLRGSFTTRSLTCTFVHRTYRASTGGEICPFPDTTICVKAPALLLGMGGPARQNSAQWAQNSRARPKGRQGWQRPQHRSLSNLQKEEQAMEPPCPGANCLARSRRRGSAKSADDMTPHRGDTTAGQPDFGHPCRKWVAQIRGSRKRNSLTLSNALTTQALTATDGHRAGDVRKKGGSNGHAGNTSGERMAR